jgi:hypothetical protein
LTLIRTIWNQNYLSLSWDISVFRTKNPCSTINCKLEEA